MARSGRNSRAPAAGGKRRGGMFTGVFIGTLVGLLVAAAMAWYFLGGESPFKEVAQAPATPVPVKPAPPVAEEPAPEAAQAPATGQSEYTFFDILPGDKTSKPALDQQLREVWWLQVAALGKAADADRLKARLSLLGLDVRVQKVPTGDQSLYRVRVGPYKTEDDALAALDTLSANNFEPKLLKESTGKP